MAAVPRSSPWPLFFREISPDHRPDVPECTPILWGWIAGHVGAGDFTNWALRLRLSWQVRAGLVGFMTIRPRWLQSLSFQSVLYARRFRSQK
jgi:hypothetical protein